MAGLKDNLTNWEKGLKDGVGTALSSRSPVYFTIARSILTESYFPSPDKIVLHSLKFFINDLVDESTLPYDVTIDDLDSPLFKVTTFFEDIKIEKEFLSNSELPQIIVHYHFNRSVSGSFKIVPVVGDFNAEVKENTLFIFGVETVIAFSLNKEFKHYEFGQFVIIHLDDLRDLDIQILFGTLNDFNLQIAFLPAKIEEVRKNFLDSWKKYIKKFDLSSKSTLYIRSVIAIKSMEDKLHQGATVASLSLPWGSHFPLTERNGYHLVWARDLFFISLAMASLGDLNFANASLDYMLNYLQRNDGSFKQNSTIEGIERWKATQMDQIAFPIILAYKLKRLDVINELKLSADYIVRNGPKTEQERWEEIGGYSAYSMSLQARALELFASMSKDKLDNSIYKENSSKTKRLISPSLLSTKGKLGDYYFVRVSDGDPDTLQRNLFLKGEYFMPSEMISNDFLYTVFTGLYPCFDTRVSETLKVTDSLLRIETPKGPSFYRYNGDIYGFDDPNSSKGRLWVLLTAERGIFELIRGNTNESMGYLNSIEKFSTKTFILPEQILEDGTPSESAAPLSWSHASYMLLHDLLTKGITPSFQEPWI